MSNHAPSRLDPLTEQRRRRARAADDPHVRPDPARCNRGRHLDHRRPLGQPRRRMGSHLSLRRLGCGRGNRRRASLPRRNELERGPGSMVGAFRHLEGWPRSLGRGRRRMCRRRDHREALRGRRVAPRRLSRTGLARRPGGGENRQLVEPGAVRQAHRPSLGARDRPCAQAARDARSGHVPPGLPLRGTLEPPRGSTARVHHRATVSPPTARSLRPLHRALLVRALLDRADPDRSRQ